MTPLTIIISVITTALTVLHIPFICHPINGSNRWLFIKGISIQPSEFLKMAIILYIAHLLKRRTNQEYIKENLAQKIYLPILFLMGTVSIILLKQPDFGQMVTINLTVIIMLFAFGANMMHMFYIVLFFFLIIIYLILFKPYRLKRILIFLNPWLDPKGAGFQIIQSLIAIGSGQLFGLGIAESKQKFFYLPMQHTDFVFSIIAEEIGFIGCSLVIFIYMLIFYLGLKISTFIDDIFCKATILGFTVLISIQALINICVVIGLLPTKGIGLPFISYGNCAIIANLLMLGIVNNLIINRKDLPVHN